MLQFAKQISRYSVHCTYIYIISCMHIYQPIAVCLCALSKLAYVRT